MDGDGLSVFDVERCVLTGSIIERQRENTTAEWKYLVRGKTVTDDYVVVVTKVSPTGKLIIITVYVE